MKLHLHLQSTQALTTTHHHRSLCISVFKSHPLLVSQQVTLLLQIHHHLEDSFWLVVRAVGVGAAGQPAVVTGGGQHAALSPHGGPAAAPAAGAELVLAAQRPGVVYCVV